MSTFVPSRHAAEEEEGPGYICGLCAWRGEPGWLEAQRRQSHPGAPMGAGENGAAARGEKKSPSPAILKKKRKNRYLFYITLREKK